MPSKFLSKLLFSLAFVFALVSAQSQTKDSAITQSPVRDSAHQAAYIKDSTRKKALHDKYAYPSPRLAMICSAVIPGLGQAYNKKYWKVPIVYAGLGTMAYFIITNQQQYNKYTRAINNPSDPLNKIYTVDNLVSIQNYFSRYRNLSIIGAAFIYMLNIVDANVDAQLHKFDVSDNISLHFSPIMSPTPTGSFNFQPGLSLAFKL